MMQDASLACVNVFLLGCLLWLGVGVLAYADRDCQNLYSCLYPLDDYDQDVERLRSPREVIRNVEEDVLGFCRPLDLQHARAMRNVMARTTYPKLKLRTNNYHFDNLLDRLVDVAYTDACLAPEPERYGRNVAYNFDSDDLRSRAPPPKTVKITFELPVGEQSPHLDTLYKLNELLKQRSRERPPQIEFAETALNVDSDALNSSIVSESTLECENSNQFFPCSVPSDIQLSQSSGSTDLSIPECGPNSHGCVKMTYNTTGIIEPAVPVVQSSENATLSTGEREGKRGGIRLNAFGKNYTCSLPNKVQRIFFM